MNITIKQVHGLTFIAKGESNHWVNIDGPKQFNGSEAASRPMELLLMSLGSCTGSDVVTILQKKRAAFEKMEIMVTGERKQDHPKVFTSIHVEYLFYGDDLEEKDVKRAIELSQNKYCPVSAMLKESCKLSYSHQIKTTQ